MGESITATPLPTELAQLVHDISEAGEDYDKAVAALARLRIDTRKQSLQLK